MAFVGKACRLWTAHQSLGKAEEDTLSLLATLRELTVVLASLALLPGLSGSLLHEEPPITPLAVSSGLGRDRLSHL